MSAHPKGRHARTRRPANLSQPRAIPARHHPKAHLDPAKIVTNPQPIPLIRNNFVVKKLEVGLGRPVLGSDVGSDRFLIPTYVGDKISAGLEFMAEKIPHLPFDILGDPDRTLSGRVIRMIELLEGSWRFPKEISRL